MRTGRRMLLTALSALLLFSAARAEAGSLRACPLLDAAFSLLEEGNPFLERYNRVTGSEVRARMPQGVPYFWGGRAAHHLFAKEPDYVVLPAWQDSPAYYRAGTKYLYGFDCVGFVRWVWEQAYGTEMPTMEEVFRDTIHHLRDEQTGDSPLWEGCMERVTPGDVLQLEHGDSRHIALCAGTLRDFGYTEEELPELAGMLDDPLLIHCTVNAQISDRFADLLKNGLPKYHAATVTDGGVCVSLLVSDASLAPGKVHQQNQDTRYYTLPDGTWLPVYSGENMDRFCWYQTP